MTTGVRFSTILVRCSMAMMGTTTACLALLEGGEPPGIKRVVRADSDLLGTLTRTQLIGGETDFSRVKEIQAELQASAIEPVPRNAGPGSSPFITPHPEDAPMYTSLASIGLGKGAAWQPKKLDAAVRTALQQGIEDARAENEKAERSRCRRRQILRLARGRGRTLHGSLYGRLHGNLRQRTEGLRVPLRCRPMPAASLSTAARLHIC